MLCKIKKTAANKKAKAGGKLAGLPNAMTAFALHGNLGPKTSHVDPITFKLECNVVEFYYNCTTPNDVVQLYSKPC